MIIYTKADSTLIIPCGLNTVVCPDTSHDLQMKTIDSSTVSQDVTPDTGYFGLYRVIVNPYELDSKTVDASTEVQVITSSKDGLFEVIVNPYTLEDKSDSITENGLYTYYPSTADGMAQVIIDVSVDTVNNQTKTVDSSTTIQYVQPDQGYTGLEYVAVNPYTLDSKTVDSSTVSQTITSDDDGLSSVTVNPYVLDTKTVNPSTNSQTVTSDEDGLSSVTVNAVTAAIDPDIVTSNIKKDVDILGVVGTFEGGTLQSKTVDSSTSSQTITPDGANYGLSSVTVNPYTEETVSDTITQNGQYTYTAQNADTLSEVTIDVSVADIPAVIQTKSVTYTQNGEYTVTKDAGYDGMSSVDISVNIAVPQPVMQTKTVSSSTNSQTVTPDQNYDGLSSVTVNPYALENKTVNSSTTQQTISADNGYDGLNMVTVNPYTLDSKTVDASTVSQTVTSSQDGLSSVTVNPYTLDSKTIDSSTVSQTITSDEDGLSSVTVNPYVLDTKTVDSSTVSQTITSSQNGLSSVTVNPYVLDTKTVDSSTVSQTITSSEDGLSSVTVNPYTTETDSSTVTQNGQYVFTPTNADTLSQVTVNVSVGNNDWVVNARKNIPTDASSIVLTANRNVCYDYLCQYATGLTAFPVIGDTTLPYMRAYGKAFTGCGTSGTVTLPNLVSATGNSAFLETFADNHVTTTSFPSLTTVDGWHVMDGMFLGNSTLTNASFPVLADVSGNYVMYFMFGYCTSLTNVSFPALTTVSGDYAMEDMFSGCTALTSMSFPELTTATGTDVFKQIFLDTSISTLSVPKLNPPTGNTHDSWDDICGPTATSIKTLTCKAAFATWERTNLQGLQNLTLTDQITDGLDLQYSPDLTAQSVLNILNAIDADATDKTISFYYDGLIVYDDAQGSIQTAYDTATAAGWTIQNLTIMPNLIDTTTDLTSLGNNLTSSQIEELLNHVDTTYVLGRTLTFATGSNYEAESYSSSLYQKYVNLGTTSGWSLQNLFIGFPDYTGWSSDGKYRHYEFDFGTGQRNAVIESDYKGYSNSYMEHVGTAASYAASNNIWLETNDGGKTTATIGTAISDKIESSTNNTSGKHTTAFGVLDDGRMILKPRANGTGLVISETTSGMLQAGSSNLRLPCKDFRFNNNTRSWNILGFRVWHNWGTTGDRSDSATLAHDVVHIKDFQWNRYKMHDRVTDRWYDLIVETS